jgi:hypothetical protein
MTRVAVGRFATGPDSGPRRRPFTNPGVNRKFLNRWAGMCVFRVWALGLVTDKENKDIFLVPSQSQVPD